MNFFKRPPNIDTTQVPTALTRVGHRDQKRDIVQLMMVKDLVVKNSAVSFTLLLEVGSPVRAPLERQVRTSISCLLQNPRAV